MKIIQSFWTRPTRSDTFGSENNRFVGGWLEEKYNLMSWAFSCLQLRKYYQQVELITDACGKSLLIDQLELPYTNTEVLLDELNYYDPRFWALGKIHAFSMQRHPFLHVDGDVYIWEKFPDRIANARLVAQNREHNFRFYSDVVNVLLAINCYIPNAIQNNLNNNAPIDAFNAGIIGGTDISFFREFTRMAFKFVDANKHLIPEQIAGSFNALYEQHLYYAMAKEAGIHVECFSHLVDQPALNNTLKGIDRFRNANTEAKYIHLFGEDAKKNPAVCAELELKLKENYPSFHQRIMDLTANRLADTISRQ